MLCEMCSSAAAMKPIIQGKRYTFRVVGTYNGTFLISDYETNSFWAPFKGEAVYGSLKGATLKQIPLYQCLWSEWLAQYPTTSVLYGEQPWRKGHGSNHSPGSPGIPITMSYTMLRPIDDRLPHNTLVLGVRSNDETKAYPLIGLDRTGAVVNDTLGETEIAIFHPPGTLQAIAFSRHIGNDVLFFEQTAAGKIMDRNTGSYWSYNGVAYQGKHKGDQLSFVASSVSEWFVWAAEYPDTEIF